METIILYGPYLLISGCVLVFYGLVNSANDVANAMGTSVGARHYLAQAILVACVFEFAGAYLQAVKLPLLFEKES